MCDVMDIVTMLHSRHLKEEMECLWFGSWRIIYFDNNIIRICSFKVKDGLKCITCNPIKYSKCIEYEADFLCVFQMKNDFKRMEDEMDHLATNMESITEFSGRISSTLQDRRQQITKLSGVHSLLKKVIIELCDSWEGDTFFLYSVWRRLG